MISRPCDYKNFFADASYHFYSLYHNFNVRNQKKYGRSLGIIEFFVEFGIFSVTDYGVVVFISENFNPLFRHVNG